jgi:uncharacterized protein YbjT (DUF2867 family)
MKTALVVGSTGLIGGQLIELLLQDNYYSKVIAIARNPLQGQHPKLTTIITDVDSLTSHKASLAVDDVYCCLGTTIKKAKTKEAFRKIDFDYPLQVAQLTKELGASSYLLVSALGANKNSSVFYNRVKGEVEEAIKKIGFQSYHIVQPSLLLGPRVEKRDGEQSMQKVFTAIDFLIPKKYKAIESIKVARAMIALAKQNIVGNFIHESKELQAF